MPCTYTGSIEGDRALAASETVTRLAQLLCGACRLLEENGISMAGVKTEPTDFTPHTTTLYQWWRGHKKIDNERKAKRNG